MQKHRKYNPGNRGWRNANHRLPESVSTRIEQLLLGAFDDERSDFATSHLKSEYLSKYCDESLTPAAMRKDNAIAKWKAQEEVNKTTNEVLRSRDMGYNIMPRVTYSTFLRFARKLVSEILGPLRDEVTLGSFSGGASTSRRRNLSSPAEKFTGQADITAAAEPYVDLIHRQAPLLRQAGAFFLLREVAGASLFTVPKKTDIDRCACKEPDINMFLQKGVGRHIRSRLRRFGINLNDQSINRRLAQLGSIYDSLATLDLSSASDSITIECVRALLPDEWYLYLNDIRSQSVEVEGEFVQTQMFSSMGNGFTFELESLIFYVLVRSVSYFEGMSGIISVYGDDVICPSGIYDMVSWVFREFGFAVNPEKSFQYGPFRESCGGHYYFGVDVTPFYLKRKPTHLTDLVRVANQLRRWAFADPARSYVHSATYKLWRMLSEQVPLDIWGGCDYAVDTQLVAPVVPNKRLVRLSDEKSVPELGRYLQWHNTNWKRTGGDVESFPPVITNNLCRLRRAPYCAPTILPQFYEELMAEAGPR